MTVVRKGDQVEKEWWWAKSSDSETQAEGYIPRNLLGLYPRVKGQTPTGQEGVEPMATEDSDTATTPSN